MLHVHAVREPATKGFAIIDIFRLEQGVIIDLRDNPDCIPTGLNLTEATSMNNAVTAVLMALNTDKNASILHMPNTSGSHRRIEVLIREKVSIRCKVKPAGTVKSLIIATTIID